MLSLNRNLSKDDIVYTTENKKGKLFQGSLVEVTVYTKKDIVEEIPKALQTKKRDTVPNDNNSTNIVEQTTTTSTSSQAPVYNLEDNELSQKVFNEYQIPLYIEKDLNVSDNDIVHLLKNLVILITLEILKTYKFLIINIMDLLSFQLLSNNRY